MYTLRVSHFRSLGDLMVSVFAGLLIATNATASDADSAISHSPPCDTVGLDTVSIRVPFEVTGTLNDEDNTVSRNATGGSLVNSGQTLALPDYCWLDLGAYCPVGAGIA